MKDWLLGPSTMACEACGVVPCRLVGSVNPGLINHGLLGGYSSKSNNLILKWYLPIQQPFWVYQSRVDIVYIYMDIYIYRTYNA